MVRISFVVLKYKGRILPVSSPDKEGGKEH